MLHVIYFISKFDIITETWFSDYEKCIVLPFVILYLKTVIELWCLKGHGDACFNNSEAIK